MVASRHRWIAPGGHRLATLAVAIASLGAALAIDSNGFIAAFVAGITFGAWLNRSEQAPKEVGELPALGGELLALVVWLLFGATLVHVAFDVLDVPLVVYAVASLTIIRALPVALCLVRAGLDRPSVAFIAWFGPRGLASIVFALLAVEELGHTSPAVQTAVAAVSLTVLLSVVLHGVSAGPFGRRYVQIEDRKGEVLAFGVVEMRIASYRRGQGDEDIRGVPAPSVAVWPQPGPRLRTQRADSAASWCVQHPCRGRLSPVPGRLTRRPGPPAPAPLGR